MTRRNTPAWPEHLTRDVLPADRDTFPIQGRARSHPTVAASVNRDVYLAAYEVYSAVHSPQAALVQGWCRGGLGTGDLIAFLYARSFPRAEWSARVDEALKGLDIT